jgi:hypothetical protein
MSGLFKPKGELTGTAVDPAGGGAGLVDPLTEITQPGGPFPFGDAILADGAGSYTITSTLRPYFISFRIPSQVGIGATVDCEHQGVVTTTSGFITTLATSLIGISVSVDAAIQASHTYDIEIIRDPTGTPVVVGTLEIDSVDGRTTFRRDLSVAVTAGTELGARITQTAGTLASVFVAGLISIELEG